MLEKDGVLYFGFFKKVNHYRTSNRFGEEENNDKDWYDDFEDFKQFKNTISKKAVKEHFKTIKDRGISLGLNHYTNIINGHDVFRRVGTYQDGKFCFPADFIYYYSNYRIGIPYEYEKYLKRKGIEKKFGNKWY